jgi:hypothetical protein
LFPAGDPAQMQAAIKEGDQADPAIRKAATKAMRKARAEKLQAEAAQQKALEKERREAEEAEKVAAEAAARAQAKLLKKRAPTAVRNKFAALEDKVDAVKTKPARVSGSAARGSSKVLPGSRAQGSGSSPAWKEARKTGLESARDNHAAAGLVADSGLRESSADADLTWDAMALKYNGFNSQDAAPSNEQLPQEWQTGWQGSNEYQRVPVAFDSGQSWQTDTATCTDPQLSTSANQGWGAAEPSWGVGQSLASTSQVDSWHRGGLEGTGVTGGYSQQLPNGNGVYKEFLTEAEQDFWKAVVPPDVGASNLPSFLSQGVAEMRLQSREPSSGWMEPAGPNWPMVAGQVQGESVGTSDSSNVGTKGAANGMPAGDEEEECVICWDGPRNALYLPCGHARFCYPCAMQTFEAGQPCPVCRSGISWVQQIFD